MGIIISLCLPRISTIAAPAFTACLLRGPQFPNQLLLALASFNRLTPKLLVSYLLPHWQKARLLLVTFELTSARFFPRQTDVLGVRLNNCFFVIYLFSITFHTQVKGTVGNYYYWMLINGECSTLRVQMTECFVHQSTH